MSSASPGVFTGEGRGLVRGGAVAQGGEAGGRRVVELPRGEAVVEEAGQRPPLLPPHPERQPLDGPGRLPVGPSITGGESRRGADEHEAGDAGAQAGVAGQRGERRLGAEGPAEEEGAAQVERLGEGGQVAGERLEREGPGGGAAVAPQVRADDVEPVLERPGERGEVGRRAGPAVEREERRAVAGRVVVEADPVVAQEGGHGEAGGKIAAAGTLVNGHVRRG